MKYIGLLVFVIFVLWGMGSVALHHNEYEMRKQEEWRVFREVAVPPNATEIKDRSFEKFKMVVIVKEYQMETTKDMLEKHYQEKLESAGWQRVDMKEGFGYKRGDFLIHIYPELPNVTVWFMYDGDDGDI
ncbi:MAG: hypothetical protein E7202_05000 [Selenomonas ruminantium]|nr:hypothetical protein [Selenomonas ruminantium]